METPIISRVQLEVDLKKIRYNYNCIKKAVSPADVMVVLKANAYGLGIKPIARELYRAGVKKFGVAEIKEADTLLKLFAVDVHLLGSLLTAIVMGGFAYLFGYGAYHLASDIANGFILRFLS